MNDEEDKLLTGLTQLFLGSVVVLLIYLVLTGLGNYLVEVRL